MIENENIVGATRTTAIGRYAGEKLQSGDSNIFIGDHAGSLLIRGDNNILIGDGVQADDPEGSNQLVIKTGEVLIKTQLSPKLAKALSESLRDAILQCVGDIHIAGVEGFQPLK